MIIFELDNVLADCEHRRHFIDPRVRNDTVLWMSNTTLETWIYKNGWDKCETRKKFESNWQAYNESCGDDKPIKATSIMFNRCMRYYVHIWSGRCESTREKTEKWLNTYIYDPRCIELKMRPIGNTETDHVLKEKWLDESKETIEMVFESDPESIAMYRRRGVFCFDCRQGQ